MPSPHPTIPMVSISTHSQMTHIFLFPTHTSQSSSSKLTFPLTQLRTTHAQCDPSRTGDHQTPPICASSRVPYLRESTLLHSAVLARDQGVILMPLLPNHHLPHHQVLFTSHPWSLPNFFATLYLHLTLLPAQAANPLLWTTAEASSLGVPTFSS